jgi:hypothetical protein
VFFLFCSVYLFITIYYLSIYIVLYLISNWFHCLLLFCTVGSLGLAGTPGTHFADFSFTALATLHEHNLLQARRLQLDSSDNLEETRSESSDPSDVDSQTGEMITGELITPVAGASSAFISDRLLRFDSPLLSPLNRSSSGSTGLLNGPLAGPLAGPLGSKLNVTSRIDEVDEAEFENSETSSSPSGRSISDQSPSDKTLSDPSVADLLAATSWHDVQSMLHHPTIKPTREAVSNALHSFQSQPPNSPPTQSSSPTTHSSLSKHSVGRSVDSSSPPNGDSAAVPESWRARALRWQRQHRHVDRLNADPNERTVDVVLNAVELLDDADELVEI